MDRRWPVVCKINCWKSLGFKGSNAMARLVSLAASLIGSAALMLGLDRPWPPCPMAAAGMVKFVGAAKLVEPPMGNCCASLPIGIKKPKKHTAAKTH